MSNSPISYWRQTKQQIPLLGKVGKIVSFTQIDNQYIGIVKLDDKTKTTASLIYQSKKPAIGDKVIGILRILKNPNSEDLIEYGIKFQYHKEI